jgi:hypothetical protein
MKNSLLILGAFTFLTSCSSITRVVTVKQLDIYGSGVIQKPVVVDLEVRESKVSGYSSMSSSTPIEVVKKNAVAEALKNAKADVLVEPKFEIEKKNNTITASVTGFPAIYKNFRPITQDDVKLLEVGVIQKAEVYEPSSTKKGKNQKK